jgi:hypothetical protein
VNYWPARLALLLAASLLLNPAARAWQESDSIPAGAILVKGAWPSASDSTTPLPEGGAVSSNAYNNPYFGLSYAVGPDWMQRFDGPPPSGSGYYVLAQLEPAIVSRTSNRGHVLIAAQDLFFSPAPAENALELLNYYKDHLSEDYTVQRTPVMMRMAGRNFVRLDYISTAAGLQWQVFATEIRCHVVEFIFTGAGRAMDRLAQNVSAMKWPAETAAPVCLKDYATSGNLIEGEDPVLPDPRFNSIPVRIVIDQEGRVKHVHFLSDFPEQARIISEALSHWRFKPHLENGLPVDVETGIIFGRPMRASTPADR